MAHIAACSHKATDQKINCELFDQKIGPQCASVVIFATDVRSCCDLRVNKSGDFWIFASNFSSFQV